MIIEIHKRETVFPGEAMEDAPDLLLVLRDRGFVSIKNKEPILEQREELAGTHHPDGIFIAYGPGIKQGVETSRRNIIDVGSTLLYSVGLDVPSDFEGKVPEKMFEQAHLARHPVKIGAATNDIRGAKNTDDDISAEEKDKIMEQLQMLGYME